MLSLRRIETEAAQVSRPIMPQNEELLVVMSERYRRAHEGHQSWAVPAAECLRFVENDQFSEAERSALHKAGRPIFSLNKIAALVRLVVGYFQNNQRQTKYMPGNDENSTETVAQILDVISKNLDHLNNMSWKESQVFTMGMITGRGYLQTTLDFKNNDFGEIRDNDVDPFTVKLDPDGDEYDIATKIGYLVRERWMSIHQIALMFGPQVVEELKTYLKSSFPITGSIIGGYGVDQQVMRRFGRDDVDNPQWWQEAMVNLGNVVDSHRKHLKVLEFECREVTWARQFVDLVTGDRELIPSGFDNDKIAKVLWFAEQKGQPMAVKELPYESIRWTTIVGDRIIWDGRSPYKNISYTGFFPYFRDGVTKGMVHDLISPQREINKRRMAIMEIIMRTAAGGWMYGDRALDPQQERNLAQFGSTPGVRIKVREDTKIPPKQIEPASYPLSQERLEERANSDLEDISGLNKSALGELDRVQSGRAIEARQRQAVIGVQPYVNNWNFTKVLHGTRRLEMIQSFYTEERIFRVLGPDGKLARYVINEAMINPGTSAIAKLNDVTIGKYLVVPNDTPLSANIMSAEFDQLMEILKEVAPTLGPQGGSMLALTLAEPLIQASNIPNKADVIRRLQQTLMAAGIAPTSPVPVVVPQTGGVAGAPPPGAPGMGAGPPSQGALPAPSVTDAGGQPQGFGGQGFQQPEGVF